ncbi:MAG: ROK family transcriptional regulator [Candidatus Latescibacteria bacterium]|nr:ROK family transcriptional regulator [Candidatus Latescibacterota bacterium]
MPGKSIVDIKQQIRRYAVLNLIRQRSPLSRGELARITGIQVPTVVNLIGVLKREGFVIEDGYSHSTAGRRSALLAINRRGKRVVGVELTGQSIRAVVTDLEGTVYGRGFLHTDPRNLWQLSTDLRTVISESVAQAGHSMGTISGIGIGIPGRIDRKGGTGTVQIDGDELTLPVVSIVEQEFHVPVTVEHDIDTAAIGEGWFTGNQDHGSLVYVSLGERIRSATMIDGRVYRSGVEDLEGPGHIVIDRNGPPCYCGSDGCLEVYASTGAITADIIAGINRTISLQGRGVRSPIRDLTGDDLGKIDIDTVIQAAQMGDIVAFNRLDQAGRQIGTVFADVVKLLRPDSIVLNGSLTRAGEGFLGTIRREIRGRVAFGWNPDAQLRLARGKDDAVAIGGAALAIRELFHVDEIRNVICV